MFGKAIFGKSKFADTGVRPTAGGGVTTVTMDSTATLFAASAEPTYAAAREGGANRYAAEFGWIGQYFGGGYEVNQVFAAFNLSSLPAGAVITAARLILTVPESYGSHTVEVRSSAFTAGDAASFVPGSGLAAKTLLGSTAFVAGFTIERAITLTGFTRANLANIFLHGQGQRTNTAPTGDTTTRVSVVKLEVTYTADGSAGAPDTFVTLTTIGAGSFTVPGGVTSVYAEAWGGGGRGSNGNYPGGGGAYSAGAIAVTPGQTLNYFVGAGHVWYLSPSYTGNINTPAQNSWVGSATTVMAKGSSNATGINQPGGAASEGFGTVKFSGGTAGGTYGGGGASASKNGNGGNGSASTGGTSPGGGAGGGSGAAGVSNVEGGGGGGDKGVTPAAPGGAPGGGSGFTPAQPDNSGITSNAARGQVRISYYDGDDGTEPTPARKAPRASFIQ